MEEALKTKESDAVLVAIDNFKKTDMSMNVNKRKTILEVFDKISEIESDNRNIENPDPKSTAKGFFQFADVLFDARVSKKSRIHLPQNEHQEA